MAFFKHHKMTGLLLLILSLIIVLKPVLGARNLDDDPVAVGDSDENKYVRWAYGLLDRWPGAPLSIKLKYGFEQKMKSVDLESVAIDYLSQKDIENAFARAFATWSAVIQVTFEEADSLSEPDIRIGFFHFDRWFTQHLVYTSLPPTGTLRLNADVRWSLDFNNENSKDAFDLESVAIHAIGHVLGLDHSHSEEAIMYRQMSPGVKKVDLTFEDVVEAQKLYGPNPEYHPPDYHQESSPHYSHPESSPAPSQLSSAGSSIRKEFTMSLGFSILLLVLLTNLRVFINCT